MNQFSTDILIATLTANRNSFSTLSRILDQPYFYEIFALETIESSMKELIVQFSTALLNLVPDRFIYLNYNILNDWNYYSINLFFLLTMGCSIGESVFNIHRVNTLDSQTSQHNFSLGQALMMSYFPKILHLISEFIAKFSVATNRERFVRDNSILIQLNQILIKHFFNIVKFLKKAIPIVTSVISVSNVVQKLRYLYDISLYHNLTAKILHFRLRKADINSTGKISNHNQDYRSMLSVISILICFRLYRWYLTSRNLNTVDDPATLNKNVAALYPTSFDAIPGGVIRTTSRHLCPLCCLKRTNSCASTGGYLFCYKCLFEYVDNHHACPITGIYCSVDDIIRIFEDDEDNGNVY